ncbi:hypothetical protein BELL_0260g00170 [Botrytis elliptica]|uniref:Uncharacterized protein n=1 Tax=Botrytis elliptica TaxID=278938 RepID=A0A4Z1JMF2_9HELO|nr:hypothetical protein BELL_0260g00170 [Botrytis elliptica]
MSTKVAEPPLWCHSESAYLHSITMHTADGKEVTINPRAAMYQMTIEQVKHHLGGVAFAQDPWPIREYTSQSIEEQWRHIQVARVAAEIARKEAELEREAGITARREACKAAKIARKEAKLESEAGITARREARKEAKLEREAGITARREARKAAKIARKAAVRIHNKSTKSLTNILSNKGYIDD